MITGLLPACSEPLTGSSKARKTSPRDGVFTVIVCPFLRPGWCPGRWRRTAGRLFPTLADSLCHDAFRRTLNRYVLGAVVSIFQIESLQAGHSSCLLLSRRGLPRNELL